MEIKKWNKEGNKECNDINKEDRCKSLVTIVQWYRCSFRGLLLEPLNTIVLWCSWGLREPLLERLDTIVPWSSGRFRGPLLDPHNTIVQWCPWGFREPLLEPLDAERRQSLGGLFWLGNSRFLFVGINYLNK